MTTAEELVERFSMQENTAEGGYFAEVYTASLLLPANFATRQPNQQLPICGSIYYMVTEASFSALHRVSSDMLYHFYAGDPVEVLLLDPSGASPEERRVDFGNDLGAGQHPSLVIPGGVWMGSRMKGSGAYAFMGVSMAPAFDPASYEIGAREALTAQFPESAALVAEYTRS
ncbi:MAG: cupin domain-containing protein [Sandaracinaceae bacterium]|nr:cupin domain-containing protein [Sandaracinaceae bacterium]